MSQSMSHGLKRLGVSVAAAVALGGTFNSATAHVHAGSVLEGYQGFVNKMKRPDGMSCCHLQDGQGNLKEEIYRGADGKEHYRVTLTKDLAGNKLPKPIVLDIPDHAVLSEKYAKDFCDAVKRDAPDDPDAATCNRPPYNVLWTPSYSESGPHTVYCYIPVPRGF